jgi:hypothetical protein
MGKRRKTFTLDPDVADQLDEREEVNASGLVNDLLREFIAGGDKEEAALRQRLEQLEREISDHEQEIRYHEQKVEQKEAEREEVRERLDAIEQGDFGDEMQQSFQVIRGIAEDNPGKFHENNPAVTTQASKHGMGADEFIDAFENWYEAEHGQLPTESTDLRSLRNGDR